MSVIQTLTFDLHVHTNYSYDGRDSVEKIIERAIVNKLDGIAICDHNTMEGTYAAREYIADNNLNMMIIPGIEVTTSQGHLLVLGIEEGIEKGLSPGETIRRAQQKEKGRTDTVVIIAPHPYHPFRHSIGNVCIQPGIDAIEVFNSRYFSGIANAIAKRTAARNNITAVAGSDAHSADCVGLATVEVKIAGAHKPEFEVILERIKKGEVKIARRARTSFRVYLTQMCTKNR